MSRASIHEFSMIVSIPGEFTDEIADRLYAAGCDDATISMQYGWMVLEFAREKQTLLDALLSAIVDVCRALPEAQVIQIDECDLVTQAEIARRVKRTRQAVQQYIKGIRGPGGFPRPACYLHDDEAPLWRWCEVSGWLAANDFIERSQTEDALTIAALNAGLLRRQQRAQDKVLVERIESQLDEACGCI